MVLQRFTQTNLLNCKDETKNMIVVRFLKLIGIIVFHAASLAYFGGNFYIGARVCLAESSPPHEIVRGRLAHMAVQNFL